MSRNLGLLRASCKVAVFLLLISAAQAAESRSDVPRYTNDPSWPKPFAHHWVMGQIGGLAVDAHDRIWVLQRALPYAVDEQGKKHDLEPAQRMPAIMVFDTQGNIVKSWGGQDYARDWPKSEHALWVDAQDNVWIGGNAPGDRQSCKFTADGRQLLEIGRPTNAARNNADTSMLGEPAGIEVDSAAHEVYVSDGYLNSRVVVYDSTRENSSAAGAPMASRSNGSPIRLNPWARLRPRLGIMCAKGRIIGRARRRKSSSAPQSIACICLWTAMSMSATGAMTGFRSSPSRVNS